MTKCIVICADDYGQDKSISQAILTLIHFGRLSAVSCLVTSPAFAEHAKSLLPFKNLVDTGLHLNFTEGKALSPAWKNAYGENFPSLPSLLQKVFLRTLKQDIIATECLAQLNRFRETMGAMPDFIDGHQHVHQFPLIRNALLKVYAEHLQQQQPYLRLVKLKLNWRDYFLDSKKILIHTTGTKAFKSLLQKQGIPHNTTFSGVYSFNNGANYPKLFPQFLRDVNEGGIIVCHPSILPTDSRDPIAKAREHEFKYLISNQFLEDCRKQHVFIKRAGVCSLPMECYGATMA